nr:MAG TPA: hypothetical protein [Caudoviricetes sp.]
MSQDSKSDETLNQIYSHLYSVHLYHYGTLERSVIYEGCN